jgi:outer membrane protein insertion porin family
LAPHRPSTDGGRLFPMEFRAIPATLLVAAVFAASAAAQTPPPVVAPVQAAPSAELPEYRICGNPGRPFNQPPAGSGPVILAYGPCFEKQGGQSMIEAQTYLYYIQLRPSVTREERWVPYDEKAEQTILEDFRRLWATNFLDDLSIQVSDYTFPNGVIGKLVTYHMEERQRVKIVDYVGSDRVAQSDIEEKLREANAQIRLDSFIDPGLVRRVTGIVRQLYSEKGYEYAEVRPETKPMTGGPKVVHLTFHIDEGPRVRIRDVDFVGNRAISDGKLESKMKENKSKGFLSFITGAGTFNEAKFGEDAQNVIDYYRERGYVAVRVGQPELRVLEDSQDGGTRWIQLRIPVTEGRRYRVGEIKFEGNDVVKEEALRPLFKLKTGAYYNEKHVRKGFEKAREIFGAGGYFEFVGYPDLVPRDQNGNGAEGAPPPPPTSAAPIVDVTMRMQPGKQYFVNRITFVGNTTTRDAVIRRELRLVENGIFNTEALKFSVKRLNQLGYFKPLEGGDDVNVEKTPSAENQVDVTLTLQEQNRNQLTFGAGVSQFEGFFGQLSFQTSNFLGRGETFTIAAQQGSRSKNYQIAFTEPYIADRPISAGVDVFTREFRYIGQFTQASAGGNLMFGFPLADFTRMFIGYSYEDVRVKELNPLFNDPRLLEGNPFLRDSLLIGLGGSRRISRISPSLVHNTVDQPLFPTSGKRLTASMDLAGIGGNTSFYSPRLEGIWYIPTTRRTSIGLRGQLEYIAPYGGTTDLPLFERLFLGGEYSMRGYDIRSVGPRDAATGLVLGGNKSLLFNAEYLINVAGPVRLVLFYDAGQVRDRGQSFAWKEDVTQQVAPGILTPFFLDPSEVVSPFTNTSIARTVVTGQTSAFKTSTGVELRFFMPVLNVPFRLIFAMNPQREGVLDNQFQQTRKFVFRFAVGSTF